MVPNYFHSPKTIENTTQNKHPFLPRGFQAKFWNSYLNSKASRQTINFWPHFGWLADWLTDGGVCFLICLRPLSLFSVLGSALSAGKQWWNQAASAWSQGVYVQLWELDRTEENSVQFRWRLPRWKLSRPGPASARWSGRASLRGGRAGEVWVSEGRMSWAWRCKGTGWKWLAAWAVERPGARA